MAAARAVRDAIGPDIRLMAEAKAGTCSALGVGRKSGVDGGNGEGGEASMWALRPQSSSIMARPQSWPIRLAHEPLVGLEVDEQMRS